MALGDKNYRLLKQNAPTIAERMKVLEERIETVLQLLLRSDSLIARERRMCDADLADLFFRLKNVELSLFPNLQSDINQLRRILGDSDGPTYNSKDFREGGRA